MLHNKERGGRGEGGREEGREGERERERERERGREGGRKGGRGRRDRGRGGMFIELLSVAYMEKL